MIYGIWDYADNAFRNEFDTDRERLAENFAEYYAGIAWDDLVENLVDGREATDGEIRTYLNSISDEDFLDSVSFGVKEVDYGYLDIAIAPLVGMPTSEVSTVGKFLEAYPDYLEVLYGDDSYPKELDSYFKKEGYVRYYN